MSEYARDRMIAKLVGIGLLVAVLLVALAGGGAFDGCVETKSTAEPSARDYIDRSGGPSYTSPSYTAPASGPNCSKGCRCGNSCIDCSKRCRK